jgi:hypothetical protein
MLASVLPKIDSPSRFLDSGESCFDRALHRNDEGDYRSVVRCVGRRVENSDPVNCGDCLANSRNDFRPPAL